MRALINELVINIHPFLIIIKKTGGFPFVLDLSALNLADNFFCFFRPVS
jgi:hypothetical protein